jgi:hypothetical protein
MAGKRNDNARTSTTNATMAARNISALAVREATKTDEMTQRSGVERNGVAKRSRRSCAMVGLSIRSPLLYLFANVPYLRHLLYTSDVADVVVVVGFATAPSRCGCGCFVDDTVGGVALLL